MSNTLIWACASAGATTSDPKMKRSGCLLIRSAVALADSGVATMNFATSSQKMSMLTCFISGALSDSIDGELFLDRPHDALSVRLAVPAATLGETNSLWMVNSPMAENTPGKVVSTRLM